jgi:phage terminase small subunit
MTSKNKIEKIEEDFGRKLTNRQKEFAKYFVEGIYSNAECVRKSGYSDKNGIARIQANKLLNPKMFPHITEYINELREEREKKYGVTLIGQLKRFKELGEKAEEEGQYTASINAEKIRSSLGGLTIDRRETNHYHAIDGMSREEIENRLQELRSKHPQAFIDAEVIDDAKTRRSSVEQSKKKSTKQLAHNKN